MTATYLTSGRSHTHGLAHLADGGEASDAVLAIRCECAMRDARNDSMQTVGRSTAISDYTRVHSGPASRPPGLKVPRDRSPTVIQLTEERKLPLQSWSSKYGLGLGSSVAGFGL